MKCKIYGIAIETYHSWYEVENYDYNSQRVLLLLQASCYEFPMTNATYSCNFKPVLHFVSF